ncbi:AraC family transcriptional regulator [Streptomyces sp. NBS 14/10]|uniref:helix-turn-helix domain-containing protein n=1 Tax=Streptomyces sp. NBS 14/10 TaxID=1945643 RepID=UPI000B7E989D|nr:AraC family transcriptional regulator [Streptomyces sp. NBS 14/10]KAK1182258.1 AraC family transcriptional regulator [Streptomyces sp. NBS 14/10]
MSGADQAGVPRVSVDVPDVVVVDGRAQSYSGNVHEELKLVLVTGSGFTVRRRGTTFRAAPGQLVVLHPDDAHSGAPDDPGSARWLIMCVSPSLIAEVAAPEAVRYGDPVIRDGGLADRFRSVHGALHQPSEPPGSALRRETGVLEFISVLARPSYGAEGGRDTGRRVPEVVREYLRANLARNVTLDELSVVSDLSKYRLARACTAWFGLPPHKLHLRLRLDRARELLRRGTGIAEVAYETGFHDQSHLTRVFAGAYGVTPARYQSTYRGTEWAGWAVR